MKTENSEAVRDSCADGLGIAVSSTWCVYQHLEDGRLVQILENYPLISEASIWSVYPSSRLLTTKVRVFIDYFTEYYGSPPYWDYHLG